jgi:spore coat protein U-like protein
MIIAASGACLLVPQPARAECAPLSFCSCTVATTDVAFGNYDPFGSANTDGTGSVTVSCTLLAALAGSYTISLSTGSSGNYSARALTNGGSTLQYNLYSDPARSQVWGNGSGGSLKVTRTFAGLLFVEFSNTVYGRIVAGQNVPAGSYDDTIFVTITY